MINDPLDKPLAAMAPYADWALRLVFAATFLFYGYNKATGLEGFANMMLDGNQFLADAYDNAQLLHELTLDTSFN